MKKKISKRVFSLSLVAIFLLSGIFGAFATSRSDVTTAFSFSGSVSYDDVSDMSARRVGSGRVTGDDYKDLKLYVGGMPFGVKFITAGVIIAGFNNGTANGGSKNPSRAAGLQCNDVLLSIDGREITSAAELNAIIEGSGGRPLQIKYSRDGKMCTTSVTPTYSQSEGRYTIGVYVRDSGAGIGTVTYIVPDSLAFGGLGHGICDSETGRLIPMQRGAVVNVKINGIVKGLSGCPGEVKGYFNSGKTGSLIGNTDCGVYGVLSALPQTVCGEPVSIGLRDSVHAGRAYVYTMLDSSKVEKYEIEISEIQRDSTTNKCFVVKVTDKRLLDKTGGIIQGMSGSPIIQDGKLVGAVTHVLINDPTTGYGIFIENMLNSANIPLAKAS